MMGGGAFDLLKTGRSGPETTKQLKISLAGFPKILSNRRRCEAALYPSDGA
jgi:hypothetical protein